jgi:adenylate kinase
MKPTSKRSYAIVVTGTPGTGKTTIAKPLAYQISANYLSLTKLVTDRRLHTTFDTRRRTRIVDMRRTRAKLRKLLRVRKTTTVIDTHVADAVPREYVRRVIVLRCHPRILEARLRRKGWNTRKTRENVIAEVLDSCYVTAAEYFGTKRLFQLETSRVTIRKSVKQCERLLKGQPPRKLKVDWIAVLNREHTLEEYIT